MRWSFAFRADPMPEGAYIVVLVEAQDEASAAACFEALYPAVEDYTVEAEA